MKRIIFIIFIIVVVGLISGIVVYNLNNQNNKDMQNNISEQNMDVESSEDMLANGTNNNEIENSEIEGAEEMVANVRIKLTVNGSEEVFAILEDNVASKSFLEMLPLTLTFEDFNSTEKIASLPNELNISGLPSGYTPEIGDLSYYAPWGNISVFYEDFRYSNSLYKLGTLESGADIFGSINEDFEVTIERVN